MDKKEVDNYSKSKLTTEKQKSNTQGGEQNMESKKKSIQDDIKLLIKGLNDKNGLQPQYMEMQFINRSGSTWSYKIDA